MTDALKEFFRCTGKGVHVAIVCCDDVDVKESDLFGEFKCVNPDSCKIPKCTNEGEELWKKGRYWYFKQIYDKGILGIFKTIIECLEKLNKDMDSANQMFTTMCDMAENEYLELGAMTLLSNALFKPAEQRSRHANVCILFFLPQASFDIFSREECYFLPMIKYIIKGVDGEEYLKEENRRKEEIIQRLEENNEILEEKNVQNEKFVNLVYENESAKNAILADNRIEDFLVTGNFAPGSLQKWKMELEAKKNTRDGDVKSVKEPASKESDTSSIDAYDKDDSSIKDSGERDDR